MNVVQRAQLIKNGATILREWLGDGATPVPGTLAQQRANLCLQCPLNGPRTLIAGTAATAIRKHIELKNRLQMRVKGEHSLGECAACGCVLRLKVHVPFEYIAPDEEEKAKLWERCWLIRESKNA